MSSQISEPKLSKATVQHGEKIAMGQGKESHGTQFLRVYMTPVSSEVVIVSGLFCSPGFTTVSTVTGVIVTVDNSKGDSLEISQYPWPY